MKQHAIQITSTKPPVVEIDTQAMAAYVRFKTTRVARTEPGFGGSGPLAIIDYDASGEVVGIEVIGVDVYGIQKLLARLRIIVPKKLLEQAEYVAAKRKAGQALLGKAG